MILAQNLRQLLNGSSIALILVIGLLGFSSCEMFRKAQTDDDVTEEEREELDEIQGDLVFNPETGKYEKTTTVIETVDTIKWITNPDAEPPISSEATKKTYPDGLGVEPTEKADDGPSEKFANYNMAVMLPFFSNRFADASSLDNSSIPAVSFYAGMKLGFDELGRSGVRLNASIYDTKGSELVTNEIMNKPEVQEADIIIGPFRKNNVKIAGEVAKNLKIPFVSPVSASSGVAKENPYFVQVNPYLPTHCQAITRHARARFKTEQIVLIARNKQAEISRFRYFQDENKKIEGDAFAERFREYIITSEDDLSMEDIDITPYLAEGDTTVFVVPSFSNKNFIYSLLLQIYTQKGNNPVVVYGFPQWMGFEPPSYDYYELLNLHVSSANYIDPNRQVVKEFKRRYFDRYGTIPSEESYVGYDIAVYFGKMIDKHGTKFQEMIDSEREELLNTRFEFFREVPLSAALAEDFTRTNLYENKFVYILKFEDFQFQKAD